MFPRSLKWLETLVPALFFALLLLSVGCSPSDAPDEPSMTPAQLEADATEGFPPMTAVSGTGELAPVETETFTIAVYGDNQGGEQASEILGTILAEIRDYQPGQPAFALSLGDIVVGPFEDPLAELDIKKYMADRFAKYLPLAKTAGVPVFNAPGNHEMDDWDEKPRQEMHEIYEEIVAPLYGAFDYGNSRFIVLNTEDVPPPGTPPPPSGLADSYVSDLQIAQLDADLAANTDKTHIFIAMHYPMKPAEPDNILDPPAVKKLDDVFAKYNNISFVLASHEHQYYNPQDSSNVETIPSYTAGADVDPYYLVSGGGGANLGASADEGGFHHYLIFDVDGAGVDVTIHRVDTSADSDSDASEDGDDSTTDAS